MNIEDSLLKESISITHALDLVKSALKDQINNTEKIEKLDNIIDQIRSLRNIELVCEAQKETIIKEMINPVKLEREDTEKYGDVNWLAKQLKKTKGTIYKYIINDKIDLPMIKQGRRVLFDKEKIHEWINSGESKTPSQIRRGARKRLFNLKRRSSFI